MDPNEMDAFKIAGSPPLRYIYQNNDLGKVNQFVEKTYLSLVSLVILARGLCQIKSILAYKISLFLCNFFIEFILKMNT